MQYPARLALLALTLALAANAARADYDPLAVPAEKPRTLDLTVHDAARDRDIPVRVYLPAANSPAPVILFSHGLGGSRAGYAYLGEHWAGRGYVAVFLQHPGSDESVWKNLPPARRVAALRRAANLDNFLLRARDVPAVLDRLAAWAADPDHPLHGRLDLTKVGMAGHSFGAATAEAVSGERVAGGKTFTDPRIKAAVVMSPSTPARADPARAFGGVHIPWLLLTGTRDAGFIGGVTPASRKLVYAALPPGDKYQLVLDRAEHSAFADRPLPGDALPRDPAHHRAILAVTTAFWDAHLRSDPAAKAWLTGPSVRAALAPADGWEMK